MNKSKLSNYCSLIPGFAFKKEDFGNGVDRVIKIGNITPPIIDLDAAESVDVSNYSKNKLAKFYAEKDDYLLAMTGATIGKVGRILHGGGYVNQRVLLFKPSSVIDKDYLYYVLCSNQFQQYITHSIDSNSAQPNISAESVGNYPMSNIPTIKAQACIGKFLNSLDRKIANNNAINAELEAMAKTIYDYWFVQFEFPDENGKPYKSSGGKMVWNEELKREIPEGWEVKTLGELFSITMGSSPKGESLNENQEGTEFYQGSTDFGIFYPTKRVYTTTPIRMAKTQDVLMSVRAPVGAMNFAMNNCCIGRGLAAINHNSPLFAWNTLKTFQKYFDIFNGNGTTFGALTSDDFKGQLALSPANTIVDRYCALVKPFEQQINTQSQENQEFASLRDFLLPLLMNGQVGFKD